MDQGLRLQKPLAERLLKKEVPRRLGCMKGGARDIKAHPWFKAMNWQKLLARQEKAPWNPPVKNALDVTHFEGAEDDEDEHGTQPYRDDGSGWDDEF